MKNSTSNIKLFYQAIKHDNLLLFQKQYKILKNYSDLSKNFVIYAFENNAQNICDFLFSDDEKKQTIEYMNKTQVSRNGEGITFLSLLIKGYKQHHKQFKDLQKYLDKIELNRLFRQDIDKHKFLALTKLDENGWNDFYEVFNREIDVGINDIFNQSSVENSAAIIAKFNNVAHIPLIKKLNETTLQRTFNGLNPFLIACKNAQLDIVKEFLVKSNLYYVGQNDEDALTLSCFNDDLNVLKFIVEKIKEDISKGESNALTISGISPLYITLSERYHEKSLYLIKEVDDDVSEGFVDLSKHLKSTEDQKFLLKFLPLIKREHVSTLIEKSEVSFEFWQNVFMHMYMDEIEILLKNPLFNESFRNLSNHPEKSHYIYAASFVGKKDIYQKLSVMLNILPVLNSEKSDNYFKSKIVDNELSFALKRRAGVKTLKSFSLASALSNLPVSQVKNLLEKTDVAKHLSDYDFLLLYSIGLQKKSLNFMQFIRKKFLSKNPSIKPEFLNLSDYIQNNLIVSQDKIEQSIFNVRYKNKYAEIIASFEESPSNLLAKIAFNILDDETTSLEELTTINTLFNNNQNFIASFNNSVIALLLQHNNVPNDLVEHYKKNQNNISKVCFAKLIDFEKVQLFGHKNIIRFLTIPFVDPSENSILSEIEYKKEEDASMFHNIYTFENVKNNAIFKEFITHQKKNVRAKHYQSKIVKHYNLRTWTILFSILNSSNPNAEDFIKPILEVTNFELNNFKTPYSNISINNFKQISHHFSLPVRFWTELFNKYSANKESEFKYIPHELLLNYLSLNKDTKNSIWNKKISMSLEFLNKSDKLNSKTITSLLCNALNNQIPTMIDNCEKYLGLLDKDDLTKIINCAIDNMDFRIVFKCLENKTIEIKDINISNIFKNKQFLHGVRELTFSDIKGQLPEVMSKYFGALELINNNTTQLNQNIVENMLNQLTFLEELPHSKIFSSIFISNTLNSLSRSVVYLNDNETKKIIDFVITTQLNLLKDINGLSMDINTHTKRSEVALNTLIELFLEIKQKDVLDLIENDVSLNEKFKKIENSLSLENISKIRELKLFENLKDIDKKENNKIRKKI